MSHSIGFEVFDTEEDYDKKTAAIETKLGIPNPITTAYRVKIKHKTLSKWCGGLNKELADATGELSDADCLKYYDRNKIVTSDTLVTDDWFLAH